MSKTFYLTSDLHWYGPHQLDFNPMPEDDVSPFSYHNENVMWLGDNVDLGNVTQAEIRQARDMLSRLIALYGDRYLMGNHERDQVPHPSYRQVGPILFAHGDTEWWGQTRALNNRRGQIGASILKRQAALLAEIFRGRDELTTGFIERVISICRQKGCTTYVCGHRHPDKIIDQVVDYDSTRIVVVPRGRTVVEL